MDWYFVLFVLELFGDVSLTAEIFHFCFCSQPENGCILAEICNWFCVINKLLCLDCIFWLYCKRNRVVLTFLEPLLSVMFHLFTWWWKQIEFLKHCFLFGDTGRGFKTRRVKCNRRTLQNWLSWRILLHSACPHPCHYESGTEYG